MTGRGAAEGHVLVAGAAADEPPGDAPPSASPRGADAADAPLTCCAKVWLSLALAILVLVVLTAKNAPEMLVAVAASVAPALFVYWLIRTRLRDPAVPTSFLISSLFLLAIPGLIVISIVEVIIAVVGVVAVLGSSLETLANEYVTEMQQMLNGTADVSLTPEQKKALDESTAALWDRIRSEIPLWKLVLVVLVLAFAVAAFTEEMSKYIVARRYRKLASDGIGCRGIIACASAGALGLAAVEHVMYATGYLTQMGFLDALGQGAYRALIAFPLHVGTAFYMGTRMARHAVLKDARVNPLKTLGVPVLFHGALDSYAFFAAAESDRAPLLAYLAIPFDCVLLLALGRLCRSSYNDVIEREVAISNLEAFDSLTFSSSDVREPPDVV